MRSLCDLSASVVNAFAVGNMPTCSQVATLSPMLLTKYGYREWLIISIICAIAASCVLLYLPTTMSYIVAGVIGVAWLALVAFFRDPIRIIKTDLPEGMMLSPADGVISAIEYVDSHDAVEGRAVILRIFLSVLNVHINRSPFDCEVVSLKYKPGKFLNAQTEESAKVNESNLIMLKIKWGEKEEMIGLRQVSGMIARMIVCPIKAGDKLNRGEKFGMIKFGSTTELILPRPDDVEVLIKKGDKVRAGKTRMAILKPINSES